MQMKHWLCIFSFAFLSGSVAAEDISVAQEQQTAPIPIYVAAYEFPPYYSSRMPKHFLGNLIEVLNQRQNTYEFLIREVRPQERYEAIGPEGCCDLIFFESEVWGWQPQMNYVATAPLIYGSDRLYSLQSEYWQPLPHDRVGGVVGYHYNFTKYQVDVGRSERDFMMYRADSQQTVLTMLRNQRIQFAILTDEFVSWLRVEQPQLVEGLYAAPEPDGNYATQIILSQTSTVSESELMALLENVINEPEVQEELERYSLSLVSENFSDTPKAPNATQIE